MMFMDAVSMGWLSAFKPDSKSRFMVEVTTELLRLQRLCAVNAVARAQCR
jgi:hypothetical protein